VSTKDPATPASTSPGTAADAVVFDLFHTLTSVESTWGGGVPMTCEMLGVSHEDWDEQLLVHSRDRLAGVKTDPLAIIRDMAHAIDLTIPEERLHAATKNRIARFAAALRDIPQENLAVLERLKKQGKLLALLSNADVMEMASWDETEAARLFDVTVFSCAAGLVKPERGIYELCLRELGVHASEAVFVGDGGSDELQGARDAGMTTVMVTGVMMELWPERVTARLHQADYVIERLGELLD
jgi:putative hydrolase of the HAD superfamily